METAELLETIARGEDSRHQFKSDVTNATALGAEIVAFANAKGGQIFIGIADNGTPQPLSAAGVRRLNELIANASANCVRPSINPLSENVPVSGGVVMVVTILEGLNKPYMDNTGAIWVKSGSDKRRITSREEMQRMFQAMQLIHADDVPVPGSSAADIDLTYFAAFFQSRFGQALEEQQLSLAQILCNMRLV